VIALIESKADFLAHVLSLCYSRSTALASVSLFALHMDCIKEGLELVRIYCSLLSCALYDRKGVTSCLLEHFIMQPFAGANHDIALELCNI
jgi:hypothetical protein